MRTIKTPLAGVQFSDYKTMTEMVRIDDSIELHHQRDNKFDPLAVHVMLHGVRIGYLPKGSEAQILTITGYINSAKLSKYDPEAKTHLMFEIELEVHESDETHKLVQLV